MMNTMSSMGSKAGLPSAYGPRSARAVIAIAMAIFVQALAGCVGGQSVEITSDPPLTPRFSHDVSDYVVRCRPGRRVRLSVRASGDSSVSVDGRVARRGTFDSEFDIATGQALTWQIRTGSRKADYHLRCLPPDFPAYKAERYGPTQAEYYLVTPATQPYVVLFDSDGVPVWWLKSGFIPTTATLLPNGNVALSPVQIPFGTDPNLGFEERRLDGRLVHLWRTVGTPTDVHEFKLLPNGNALMITYVPRSHVDLTSVGGPADGDVWDAEVQEVGRDGKLVWQWKAAAHIDIEESKKALAARPQGLRWDLFHANSVEPDGDGIILSLRRADAVYRVERSTGAIDWKLGGVSTSRSLSGVDSALLGGQHDARVLPDGSVTVHDNSTLRDRPPRVVRILVNRAARTARLVEAYSDPNVTSSHCCGSARRLRGGHWVVSWGGNRYVTELSSHGEIIFRLTLPRNPTYRAEPVLPGVLSLAALRAAMDAQFPR